MDFKQILKLLQDNGIPVVLLRDIVSKGPSLSFTLVVISFCWLTMGIFSNYFSFLKGIDGDLALNTFMTCACLYWGRKINIKGNTLEKDDK